MIELHGFELHPETIKVIGLQYERLEQRYGRHGEHPLTYHDAEHSMQVATMAGRIALKMGKPAGMINDLVIAGMFHDDEHMLDADENERASADYAVAALRGYPFFTGKHRDRIHNAILGTIIDHKTWEQFPTCEAGQILADADLSSLGMPTPIYRQLSERLFEEYHPGKPHDGEEMYKFLGKSIELLTRHVYFTKAASEMLPHQAENLAFSIGLRQEIGQKLGAIPSGRRGRLSDR